MLQIRLVDPLKSNALNQPHDPFETGAHFERKLFKFLKYLRLQEDERPCRSHVYIFFAIMRKRERLLRLTVRSAWLSVTAGKCIVREDSMSIRIVSAIVVAAVSMVFGFTPAGAQKPPSPQTLRLYVLDCGIITPANLDAYGLKPSDVKETRMITPCFLI